MKDRIKRIFTNLDKNIDTILITNDCYPHLDFNFFYFTGIESGVFEGCYAIMNKNGKNILLTSQLEEPIARKETDFEIIVYKDKEDRKNKLKEILSGVKNLGFNSKELIHKRFLELSELSKCKLIDISKELRNIRSIKDKNEIDKISEACKISSRVVEKIADCIKPKITEKQLSNEIASMLFKEGATNLAFSPPIVAFGKNSSQPHHFPGNIQLRKNEFVLVDLGAEYKRYMSDMTRTFVFGKADKKMKEIYETVLNAQMEAIDMVRDGVNGRDIDKFARSKIEKIFKGRFIHGLGHEIGLSIHDGNRLNYKIDFPLKKNMVITIEPGVYIPAIGGVRIEDSVLVTKGKAKVLTDSSKDLIEI